MQDIFPPIDPLSFGSDLPSEDGLKMVSRCPVCQNRYNPIKAKVIDESEGAHLVHVRCQKCQSSVLALVLMNQFGISSVGLIVDLDDKEIINCKEMSPISSDEMLYLHQLIFNNSFEKQIFS